MKMSFMRVKNGSTQTELWICLMIGFIAENREFLWVSFRFISVNPNVYLKNARMRS